MAAGAGPVNRAQRRQMKRKARGQCAAAAEGGFASWAHTF